MKRELWFADDIGQVLLAARTNLLLAGVDGDYRRGFEAALVTVAIALGLADAANKFVGDLETQNTQNMDVFATQKTHVFARY